MITVKATITTAMTTYNTLMTFKYGEPVPSLGLDRTTVKVWVSLPSPMEAERFEWVEMVPAAERDEARELARDLFLQVGDRIRGGPFPDWLVD